MNEQVEGQGKAEAVWKGDCVFKRINIFYLKSTQIQVD